MEEKGEKWERVERIFSLPVVMNEEIEFCIWGWVGICSNKSGEFCIWGYSIEGVGVSVLAEFVRGECSGRSSNGNNLFIYFDKSEQFDWWESGGMWNKILFIKILILLRWNFRGWDPFPLNPLISYYDFYLNVRNMALKNQINATYVSLWVKIKENWRIQ